MPNLTTNIIRQALASWAHDLVADVVAELSVVAGPVEAGEKPELPSVGIEWGTATPATEYSDVVFDDTGEIERWKVQEEEVDMAFVWRAYDIEDADSLAHEFIGRAAIAAQESNPEGNRVLHFDVNLEGSTYGCKLYLMGTVEPPGPVDSAERSLFVQRIPASVIYPAIYARAKDYPEMNVGVTVNGVTYPKPSLPPEPEPEPEEEP
jgi:hypothetical protein